jgi:hypothetical protein
MSLTTTTDLVLWYPFDLTKENIAPGKLGKSYLGGDIYSGRLDTEKKKFGSSSINIGLYVKLNNINFSQLTNHSTSLWFNTSSTKTSSGGYSWGEILDYDNDMFAISYENNNIRLRQNSNGTANIVSYTSMLNDGAWHHLVITFNNGVLKYYLDGNFLSQISGITMGNSSSNFLGWSSTGADRLYGNIDDYRFYAATLSDADVTTLYTTTPVYPTNWTLVGDGIFGLAAEDGFGYSTSLNSDGTVLAVGTPYKNQVRVFSWDSGTSAWIQKGQNIDTLTAGIWFGFSVSVNADGTIVAVGAKNASGSGGSNYGYVRVFYWNSGTSTWIQKGANIVGEAAGDESGYSISLSADGTIIAIGAPVNANLTGQVRVYYWDGTAWVQRGQDIDGETTSNQSGYSVSLSTDGSIVAIGAPNNNDNRGHARVYYWNGTAWVQRGQDIDGLSDNAYFYGFSISLNGDGTIVAIGAPGNLNENQGNLGYVRILYWNSGTNTWTQKGVTIVGTGDYGNPNAIYTNSQFGYTVSLSSDGSMVAVGARLYDGAGGRNCGLVRVFNWSTTTNSWVKKGFDLEGSSGAGEYGNGGEEFGTSVSVSSDGAKVAVGIPGKDINSSNIQDNRGQVRVYTFPTVKNTPTITNFTIPTKQYGDAPFTLTAPTSNSSGAFTYTSANTSVATIAGSTATILSTGSTVITATQAETSTYNSATITATLTVNKQTTVLSSFIIADKNYGDQPFTIPAPTSNRTGTFQYSSVNTSVATISGEMIVVRGTGTTDISATQLETANSTAATITTSFTVGVGVICFLQGTQLTCLDEETGCDREREIEEIKPGDFVKTYLHGYVPVKHIGCKTIANPKHHERIQDRLYRCSSENYPDVRNELILTGCHAILEDPGKVSELQKEQMMEILGDVYATDDKVRLIAMVDERTEIYETDEEESVVWHLCLEHEDEFMNYGIYANGLLVESCSEFNIKIAHLSELFSRFD